MWLDFVSNPKEIADIYDEVPALSDVTVTMMKITKNELSVFIELDSFPDHYPPDQKGNNTCNIELGFKNVDKVYFSGWEVDGRFTFKLSKVNSRVKMFGQSDRCTVSLICDEVSILSKGFYITDNND
ncbi:Imm50 family immunity protein [Salinithrix halophila]|uniref:Imm50 family immunity protein n=1 Tax=Salinithrix halophila TaxID=1485204 RepID=A0ABV8JCV2_9BACL